MLNLDGIVDTFNQEGLHTVCLTENAYQEWLAFSNAIEKRMRPDGDLKDFTDWGGKAPGAAVRIAGVLHGINHGTAYQEKMKLSERYVLIQLL